MHTMSSDPVYGAPLETHRAKHRYGVFERLESLETSMCQKPVESQANTDSTSKPPEKYGHTKCTPREIERCQQTTNMESGQP